MTPTTGQPSEPTRRRSPQALPAAPTRRELRAHPAVRNYTLLCLAALFLLVVCLAHRGLDWWSLIPALIGCVTLLAQWGIGPPLLLVSLSGLIVASTRANWRYQYGDWLRDPSPTMMDLLLCVAVLAYVVGHYRLLALMRHIFPPDARRLPGSAFADPARCRSVDLVSSREPVLLLLSLPLWTSLAVAVWNWIMADTAPWEMDKEIWQALRLIWAGLAIVATAGIAAAYLRQSRATPEESLLYLQDQLWRHTRREQDSINRWLARARWRSWPGKEKS